MRSEDGTSAGCAVRMGLARVRSQDGTSAGCAVRMGLAQGAQ